MALLFSVMKVVRIIMKSFQQSNILSSILKRLILNF